MTKAGRMRAAVLFVEDSADDVELLLRTLHRSGAEPEWRRIETREGLREALEERTWDVALLDYNLPRFGALEALVLLHELDPDLPAIVVSGTVGAEVAVETMRAGAADYVLKDDLRRLGPAVAREVEDGATRRERRRLEEAFDVSEQRYKALFEQSPVGVVFYDEALRLTECNERLAAMLGVPLEDSLGFDLTTLHTAALLAALRRPLAGREGQWVGSFSSKINGATFHISLSAAPLRAPGGAITGGIAVIEDLTERQRFLGAIEKLSYEDPVTRLPNATLFRDRLRQAVAQARREGEQLAVVVLDLDRFKHVNDTLGRTGGDRLLNGVGRRLHKLVRDGDTVARVAADEFAVILPGIEDLGDVAAVAEKTLEALRRKYRIGGHDVYVNASLGLALFPGDSADPEKLIRFATAAMHEEKARGGNGWRLFDESMSRQTVERLQLEARLHRALEQHEFVVHYQPLVQADDGLIVGMEALMRWQDPEDGLVLPGAFIPVAEDTGLIVPLGEEVLAVACRAAAAWLGAGLEPGRVSVNLSARQFRQKDLVATIERTLAETGLEPSCLELEITESLAMDDVGFTREVLGRLRDLGVRSALDDFGTGYSSLSHLSTLPFDVLKIDRGFVAGIREGSSEAAIVRAVVALGRELGLTVVAEGVETREELDFVRKHGCQQVQGFLFSRPVPAEEAQERLAAGRLMA